MKLERRESFPVLKNFEKSFPATSSVIIDSIQYVTEVNVGPGLDETPTRNRSAYTLRVICMLICRTR